MNNENLPKVIAIYLPQFHETDFNNKHWGKGYTEWIACKKAEPLFKGHRQPRVPYQEHYYDLTNINEIDHQAKIAKQYGIDGFAIYQYYSCGDKLLNKPLELLRDHPEIKIDYYLFWANQSWRSNWFGKDKSIIWEQRYGDKEDWKQQYAYCSLFFHDDRYIKIDNKPIYMIYQPWEFQQIDKFIDCWNKLAKDDGFEGIYFVKNVTARNTAALGKFDAIFERQPFFELGKGGNLIDRIIRIGMSRVWEKTNTKGITKHILWKRDYKKACDNIVKMVPSAGKNTFLGAFTGWDNTPRKGYNGSLFLNESPNAFKKCLVGLLKKAQRYQCPQIIINAWNEWAEGMYLEPDTVNGYKYLKAVVDAKEEVKNGAKNS